MEADATKEEVSMFNELDQECIRLRKENAALREALQGLHDDIDGLMGESSGVYGLHLNGDPSPWGELIPGGRFERLEHLDIARAALQGAKDD
ncbi:MAG: hypothetical protein KGL39_59330 [Patescibacteria group bacterium]|nr:hypothetical protein [Patescibacteria group bacterium]